MDTFIVIVTKYLFILLMLFYTWESFSALIHTKRYQAAGIFQRQNAIIFVTYILGIVTIFMNQKDTTDVNVIILGGLQMCFLIVVLGIFPIIYPNINKGILSNMCMLLTIGFIILARLSFEKSVKQFIIVAVVTMLSLIVPYLMSRFNMWKSLTWIYCFVGLGLLVAVLVVGTLSRGAKLYIKISGFTFQPSEFVKIIFVFFIAGMLSKSAEFGHLILSAVFAGLYVIVLVIYILYDVSVYGICWNKEGSIPFYRNGRYIDGFGDSIQAIFPCSGQSACMEKSFCCRYYK